MSDSPLRGDSSFKLEEVDTHTVAKEAIYTAPSKGNYIINDGFCSATYTWENGVWRKDPAEKELKAKEFNTKFLDYIKD